MFKNFFKKEKKENSNKKNILVTALLIHAAKIDENYTEIEKKIIKQAIINLNEISQDEATEILKLAEKKEEESNQIIEFTREIKQYPMEFRLKIIEIIWKIVYSDGTSDNYESNLIRRICGLLYISDKDNGNIKIKVKNSSFSLSLIFLDLYCINSKSLKKFSLLQPIKLIISESILNTLSLVFSIIFKKSLSKISTLT